MTQIRFDGCDLSPRRSRAPRYGQRSRAAALAVPVLVALLAGCGGGSHRLAKADYEREVNDAGRNLSAAFGTVNQRLQNLHQLAVRIARARTTLDDVTTRLQAIEPPKGAEQGQRDLVSGLRAVSDRLEELRQAAASGDRGATDRARARLNEPATGRKVFRAIQELQQAGFAINTG